MNDIIIPIRLKVDTKAAYETANEPLLYGEVAIVFDGAVPKIKIGNVNEDNFSDLPYFRDSLGGGMVIGETVDGGTAGRVLYVGLDGELAQSSNYIWDYANNRLGLNVSPETTFHIKGGVSGAVGMRVAILEGNLPELYFKDTSNNQGFAISKYGNQVYLVNTNSVGGYLNYAGMIQLSSGKWTFGGGHNPSAMIDVRAKTALDTVALFQGIAFQEGNLTEWRSSSSLLARVSPLGHLFVPVVDSPLYKQNGVSGFTGTGAYTNFTISGGIITAAS